MAMITENERKKLSPRKRRCKNLTPEQSEQFIKKRNIQTKSVNFNNCTRPDTVYRYYDEDTDTLSVYFAKASSGVVSQCKEANDYSLVSYDQDDKMVSVEIFGASKLLCCHLFDIPGNIDDRPPLSLNPIYYEHCDRLEVFLTDSETSFITFQKTEEKDFEVGMDDKKNIVVLSFYNASSRLAKTLPEKEREKLAEEAKLRSLEIANWSYLLD